MTNINEWEQACADSQLEQYQAAMRLQHAEALIGRITERLEGRKPGIWYSGISHEDYNLLLEAKNLLEEFHIAEVTQ